MKQKLHKDKLEYKDTEDYYYVDAPVYEKYETKLDDTYCEDCGSVIGTHEVRVGVNLLGYEKKKYKKDMWYYTSKSMEKYIADSVIKQNKLVDLFYNK